jgi:hypothetical protein
MTLLSFIAGVIAGCLIYSGRGNTCVCPDCRRLRWWKGE